MRDLTLVPTADGFAVVRLAAGPYSSSTPNVTETVLTLTTDELAGLVAEGQALLTPPSSDPKETT